ncbi:MAG: DUF4125 family protein [Holophaga sp.]|nr:DUF4125 family protein [Holophaga sp.]
MPTGSLAIIGEILAIEWEMLQGARGGEPAGQEEEETFRLMRWMTHAVLPDDLLTRLLQSLEQAKRDGRNVMIEKYARMEGKIPALSESPLIGQLADLEGAWMAAVQRRYPLTFPGAGDTFRAHLTSELETFPEDYLEALGAFETNCQKEGRNLVEERYQLLFQRLGYASIEAREHQALLDTRKCSCQR